MRETPLRNLSLIACAALALSACGKKDAAEQASNTTQDIAPGSVGGGDTTAIDAATSQDANMAADVEYNAVGLNADDAAEDNSAGNKD